MVFLDYLKTLVERSNLPFSLRIFSGIATMSAEETFKPHALREEPHSQQGPVTFKITTPLFYAQIARCTSIPDYVKVALSKPDPATATFHTSHPVLLTKLVDASPSVSHIHNLWPWSKIPLIDQHAALTDESHPSTGSPQKHPPPTPSHTTMDETPLSLNRLHWLPIHLLRRLPSSPPQLPTLSDLDACAARLPATDAPKVRAYRKAVLKMLVSDYVAFGLPAVIDAALWIVRIWLCWRCVLSFDGSVGLYNAHASLSVIEVAKVVLGCLGVHLWRGLGEVV